jgi:ribosome-interacting GTPase 1
MEEVEEIGSRPNSIPISCSLKLNMEGLLERIWEMMALVRLDRQQNWAGTGNPRQEHIIVPCHQGYK